MRYRSFLFILLIALGMVAFAPHANAADKGSRGKDAGRAVPARDRSADKERKSATDTKGGSADKTRRDKSDGQSKTDAPRAEVESRDKRADQKRDERAGKPEKPEREKKLKAPIAKIAKAEKVKRPCFAKEVHVARKRGDELEHRHLALTFCDGSPNPSALDSISVLARPRDVERPLMPEIKAYQKRSLTRGPAHARRLANYLSEQVMRVHPDLLVRLQKVSDKFPGKMIEIISGHRPDARETSRHHHGRALDVRVEGVSREVLRDFLRTLDQTGVGYYPNSYFVHMDVRDDRGFWVDRSGPGEAADYGPWPPKEDEIKRARERVLTGALRDLAALAVPGNFEPGKAKKVEPDEEKAPVDDEPEAQGLNGDEIARIRSEALAAVQAL